GLQAVLFHHSHHAYNSERLFRIEPQVLADGIALRPEALRELLFNDDYLRHLRRVVLREVSAFSQGDLHGAKIVRARDAYVHLQFLAGRWSVALDVDASPTHRAGQRQHRHQALCLHTREARDAALDLLVELDYRLVLPVFWTVGGNLHTEHA